MTLRDLKLRQLYNLRRRCEKERKLAFKKHYGFNASATEVDIWQRAYNAGLKAGLELNVVSS